MRLNHLEAWRRGNRSLRKDFLLNEDADVWDTAFDLGKKGRSSQENDLAAIGLAFGERT